MTGGDKEAASARPARELIGPLSRPALARHVQLRFDETRQVWILLAPERLLTPSETAVAVLQQCNGARTVAEIADVLAAEFDAPARDILDDVLALLQDLADRRFLAADAAGAPAGKGS